MNYLFVALAFLSVGLSFGATIFSPDLSKCDAEMAKDYGYTHFYELEKLHEVKSWFGIKLKVYAMGRKDMNIILSPTQTPKDGEEAYEFVIGGNDGNAIFIRSQKAKYEREGVITSPNVFNPYVLNEIVIEVSHCGKIRITVNEEKTFEYTTKFIDAKYVSFSGYENSPAIYYFNCKDD